MSVSDLKPR